MDFEQKLSDVELELRKQIGKVSNNAELAADKNKARFEDLASDVKKDLDDQSSAIGALKQTVSDQSEALDRLSKRAERPWFRQPSFWAGVSALPALVLGGWIVKSLFNDAALISLIHKGFGTEIAVQQSMSRGRPLYNDLETALADSAKLGGSKISLAIQQGLGETYVTQEKLRTEVVSSIQAVFPATHISLMDLGLLDPLAYIRSTKRQETNRGLEEQASTAFSASPGQKIQIHLAVSAKQYDFFLLHESETAQNVNERLALLKASESVLDLPPDLSDLVMVKLENSEQDLEFIRQPIGFMVEGGQNFAIYSSDEITIENSLGAQDFPLRTLSFSAVPFDARLRLAVVVRRVDA